MAMFVIATVLAVMWLPRRAVVRIIGRLRRRRDETPNPLGASPLRDL
jgi:hypothetical protein